jgi:hypothetical protein
MSICSRQSTSPCVRSPPMRVAAELRAVTFSIASLSASGRAKKSRAAGAGALELGVTPVPVR